MSDKNNPHIAGRYALLVALIGLIGTFGAICLNNYFENNRKAEEERQKDRKDTQNQKEYDQLIIEGDHYYDNKDYDNALSSYRIASGKVSKNYSALRGITKCKDKLKLIAEKRQVEIAAANAKEGTFTDTRDGQTYKWVRLKDGKKWMAQNLNFEINDSWCYDNEPNNCAEYGRLYTLEAAINACLDEWRLPIGNEWKKILTAYGGYYDWNISKDIGSPKDGYKALIQGGSSGFSALLGGSLRSDGNFYNLSKYGNYWSSPEKNSFDDWYFYTFRSNNKPLRYNYIHEISTLSCRCLQD